MTSTQANLAAAGCLLVSALIWSTIPLFLTFGVGAAPMVFVTANRFSAVAINAGYLLAAYPQLRSNPKTLLRTIYPKGNRRLHARITALVAIGKLEWVTYIAALSLASPHIVVMLADTWPAIMIIGLTLLNRGTGRYRKTGTATRAAVLACFAGGILLAAPGEGTDGTGLRAAGAGLAALTALLSGGHHAVLVRWGDQTGQRLRETGLKRSQTRARVLGSVWMQCTSQLICASATLTMAVILGENLTWGTVLAGTALGVFASGLSDTFFRTGTALATNTAVTMVVYITPLLSLLWLELTLGLTIENTVLTALGAAAIIGGNAAIAADSARNHRSGGEPGRQTPGHPTTRQKGSSE